MPVSPGAVVAPPPTTLPCHSLLDSAVIVEEPEGSRWESGFVFQPENCIEAEAWKPCGNLQNEIVNIFISATSGTWSVQSGACDTGPLAFDISAADLQTAFEGLLTCVNPALGAGDVIVTGGVGNEAGDAPYTIEFTGQLAGQSILENFPLEFTIIDLEGGTAKLAIFGGVLQPAGVVVEQKKEYDGNQEPIEYAPFIIEVPYTCSSFGFQAADYEAKALRQIDVAKGKALEYEFWTGQKDPDNLNLVYGTPNDDDHILNPGGAAAPVAVSPGLALVLLSQALANCGTGSQGMIHATTGLAERWGQLSMYNEDQVGLLLTSRCDIIVSGSGYPGTGPNGQPPPGPHEVWVYATGMVAIRMGAPMLIPETFSEAFDRHTNTVTYRGEITASAVHDGCCSFAVLVDICGTT